MKIAKNAENVFFFQFETSFFVCLFDAIKKQSNNISITFLSHLQICTFSYVYKRIRIIICRLKILKHIVFFFQIVVTSDRSYTLHQRDDILNFFSWKKSHFVIFSKKMSTNDNVGSLIVAQMIRMIVRWKEEVLAHLLLKP